MIILFHFHFHEIAYMQFTSHFSFSCSGASEIKLFYKSIYLILDWITVVIKSK